MDGFEVCAIEGKGCCAGTWCLTKAVMSVVLLWVGPVRAAVAGRMRRVVSRVRLEMNRQQIIGGLFALHVPQWVPLDEPGAGAAPAANATLFCNVRSAMYAVLKCLRPRRVWFPSYLCPSMTRIPAAAGRDVRYFPVNKMLGLTDLDWVDTVEPTDAVVMISYFGFPIPLDVCALLGSKGAWLIEDASQAWLSEHIGEGADYVVCCPRKFLGVPDGGVLVQRRGAPSVPQPLETPEDGWLLQRVQANVLRLRWDSGDATVKQEDWFRASRRRDFESPCGSYAMSSLSRALIRWSQADMTEAARIRRQNYNALYSSLGRIALLGSLGKGTVPLGFPVRVPAAQRSHVLNTLVQKGIYPPVHWNQHAVVPSRFQESHLLADEELTLPCDQRYDVEDMARLAEAVKLSGAL